MKKKKDFVLYVLLVSLVISTFSSAAIHALTLTEQVGQEIEQIVGDTDGDNPNEEGQEADASLDGEPPINNFEEKSDNGQDSNSIEKPEENFTTAKDETESEDDEDSITPEAEEGSVDEDLLDISDEEDLPALGQGNPNLVESQYDPMTQKIDGKNWGTLFESEDGKFYYAMVEGKGNDHDFPHRLYEINKKTYEDARQDRMLSCRRLDKVAFDLVPFVSTINYQDGSFSFIRDDDEFLVKNVDYHFHNAYAITHTNGDFTRNYKNVIWEVSLNKDLVLENVAGFDPLDDETAYTFQVHFNAVIDGYGHKIYSKGSNRDLIVILPFGINPEVTVKFRNIVIDGTQKNSGIATYISTNTILEDGTVIQNCNNENYYHGSGFGGAAVNVGPFYANDFVTPSTLTIGDGVTIKDCTNYCNFGGGAIYLSDNSSLHMTGGTISNCRSLNVGGAISAVYESANIDIKNATFFNNRAEQSSSVRECSQL